MIADFGRESGAARPSGVAATERSRRTSANVRPAPKAPILRKFRRESPSQNPGVLPRMVNMMSPPLKVKYVAGLYTLTVNLKLSPRNRNLAKYLPLLEGIRLRQQN